MNFELLLRLFWEFFKTGLFAVGGGLATIPFLYEMMEKFHWFTPDQLMDMIAVSEATPGPMGVNMATYVGYEAAGHTILGAITTTVGLVLPSMIVICIVAKFLKKFKEARIVQDVFYGLRPAVCALIASAGLGVFMSTMFAGSSVNWLSLVLFGIIALFVLWYRKMNPILLICLCALMGIALGL